MIQVIDRTFKIMELLSPESGMTLDAISILTGLNKGTLCNILKSLVELGYVEKAGSGSYIISKNFYRLASPYLQKSQLQHVAEVYVERLASETKESGVIATLSDDGEVEIIAQYQYQRSVMVSMEAYSNLSLYGSVTGRILLSNSPENKLKRIVENKGYPKKEWGGIDRWDSLLEATASIRKNGVSVMESKQKEIKSIAVPVMNKDKSILLSMGLTVPFSRLNEATVVNALNLCRKEMSSKLQN